MKIYVGLKENTQPSIFESESEPSKEARPNYDIIYGPFKSRGDAEKYIKAMGRGVACSEG